MTKKTFDTERQDALTESQQKTLLSKSTEKPKSGLLVYTAKELLTEFNGKETDFLWDNLIPRVGTGLLVGQPDLGKSQLVKELAIMITKGSPEYLNLKLKPIHQNALCIFTEDYEEGVASSLYKQLIKHPELDTNKLRIAFLNDETIDCLINKIDEICSEKPFDLVIVDAFGDIFSGSDSNNNISMRRTIAAFDDIVRRYSICLMFVHHINKSGYNKTPSQELIQGGSGLVQRVRFALFLSKNDDGQIFLNLPKGNQSPKFYKENRLPVNFDEDTLTFEVCGEWEPLNNNKKGKKEDLTDISLYNLMKNDGFTYSSLSSKIMVSLSISKSTAERRIAALLQDKRVIKQGDLYYYTEANVEHLSVATITSKILGKNEGEGDTAFPHTDEFNITTLNPQTLIDFEGEGTEASDIILDEIQHPTVKSRFIELEINQSTVNPQNLLGNEGEGELDAQNIVNLSFSKIEVVEIATDTMIKKIHDELFLTDYAEDENLHCAIEDFFQKAPEFLKSEEISYADLECYLQDEYHVDAKQGRLMVKILMNLNVLWIDDDAFIRA